jgi:malonate-semialdehyde dehydrogenase (acetylating)/methylmalonate-semialdehyde dehydrogenase
LICLRKEITMLSEIKVVPVWIGGRWRTLPAESHTPVHNPATGEIIARTPMLGAKEVEDAVQAASLAFETWSRLPATKRAAVLFQYRTLLETHFEELAALIVQENGKTQEEARGDVRRGLEVVEFACGIAHLTKGESLPQVADGIDGQTHREPVGVCAGITPFNFPAMVPLWMFPLAIACGNTFILKPSEKVPLTANRLAGLFAEAGLPDGVFNIIHGGREVVDALCTHPQISALSFVGSTGAAKHVYTLGSAHGKRVQAAGGAKNVLLVMPDADPDSTLRAILGSAFGCAGQRCMAGSVLMGVGEAADSVRGRVAEAAANLTVGDPALGAQTEMGPVIDGSAQQRIVQTIGRGTGEGAALVRDGRSQASGPGFFVGPTLFDYVTPGMALFEEEIFGPVLSLMRPSSLEEAIAWMRRTPYGNGATIFTGSGGAARQFAREMPCGMIGVNIGVPAPMPLFSFSGWNQSFFGDLHVQGMEGVLFYTRQKIVLSRWDDNYQRRGGW